MLMIYTGTGAMVWGSILYGGGGEGARRNARRIIALTSSIGWNVFELVVFARSCVLF